MRISLEVKSALESRKEVGQRQKTPCSFTALLILDCGAGSKERVKMKTGAEWIVADMFQKALWKLC